MVQYLCALNGSTCTGTHRNRSHSAPSTLVRTTQSTIIERGPRWSSSSQRWAELIAVKALRRRYNQALACFLLDQLDDDDIVTPAARPPEVWLPATVVVVLVDDDNDTGDPDDGHPD